MGCFNIGNYHEPNVDWLIIQLQEALKNWDATEKSWEETKQWITDYFANLDIDAEINAKLDEMLEDGTLEKVINQEIFGELNQKVEENTQDIATANQNITTANQKIAENAEKVKSVTDVVSGAGLMGSCIIIADSYGGKREGVTNSFLDLLEKNLPALGYSVTTKYIDGGGMSSDGNQNFTSLLKTIAEPQYVDFILVCGGVNDANRDYNTNSSAVESFVKYAVTRCKQLFLCFSSWVYAYGLWEKGAEAFRAWSECTVFSNRAYFINGLQVMQRYGNFLSDLNHPTQTGNNYLYAAILNYLRNKMNTYVSPWFNVALNKSTATTSISGTFSQKMINNIVCMRWPLLTFTGTYNNFFNSGANFEIELASYTPGILMPTNSSTFIICHQGVYSTSSEQKNCTVMLYFTPDGKLMCGIHSVENQGNESATQIVVLPGQITYNDLMY